MTADPRRPAVLDLVARIFGAAGDGTLSTEGAIEILATKILVPDEGGEPAERPAERWARQNAALAEVEELTRQGKSRSAASIVARSLAPGDPAEAEVIAQRLRRLRRSGQKKVHDVRMKRRPPSNPVGMKTGPATNDLTVAELTVIEINSIVGALTARRRVYSEELAQLFAAAQAGQHPEAQPTQLEELIRQETAALLNGHADGADLKLAAPASRNVLLEAKIGGIDRAVATYGRKELIARAVEAASFALERGPEWLALCRDILLTAEKLRALEARAVQWRENLAGSVPADLPLARYIGIPGRSIVGANWTIDPLSRPRAAALEAKIITARELKDANA